MMLPFLRKLNPLPEEIPDFEKTDAPKKFDTDTFISLHNVDSMEKLLVMTGFRRDEGDHWRGHAFFQIIKNLPKVQNDR